MPLTLRQMSSARAAADRGERRANLKEPAAGAKAQAGLLSTRLPLLMAMPVAQHDFSRRRAVHERCPSR